ncbi:MAG: esterase [Elusimicrobia bacterium]|nr:esterase [Elusimicrobiota bacterium]
MALHGKLLMETVGSLALKGNPLGDPRLREVPVYLPASYTEGTERRYPVIYFLVGFTGYPKAMAQTHPFRENVIERFDRLVAAGRAPEAILVVPDGFTRYGGSQYLNSEGTGRYEDHLVGELVGYIDGRYRTAASPAGRAVMGKSSGGYAAWVLAMRHPEAFGHCVSHSGDSLFEVSCVADFPKCVNELEAYGGDFMAFLDAFRSAPDKASLPHSLVNVTAMSSVYSPNPKGPWGFDLPFDVRTGQVVEKVFSRWLAHDPVRLAAKHAKALRGLKTLYFDAGTKDEFYLHLGARALSRELKSLKVPHVHEEHGGGHMNIDGRYDEGFARLKAGFAAVVRGR